MIRLGQHRTAWRRVLRRTGLGTILCATFGACGGDPPGEPQRVAIPSGATFSEVADTLRAQGIVSEDRSRWFGLYARLRGDDRKIRAGHYELRQDERWRVVLDHLTSGRVVTDEITIPEGFTLRQMSHRIATVAELDPDSVYAQLVDGAAARRLGVPGPALEGYLFPDTYRFEPGAAVDLIVETMIGRYRSFWSPERRARLERSGLTERQAVTLASIVQAEARRVEEMTLISSVFHNRLARRYPLQADPTVLYALGGWRERLLYAAIDSVADHPYNTYRIPGLPPGPIGAPGELALQAAIGPDETDYLYFVARPDGSHLFTRSLEAHNRARLRARREWDAVPPAAATTRGPEIDSTAAAGGA